MQPIRSIQYRYNKLKQRIWQSWKAIRSRSVGGPPVHVFWILGCQRSGTTFMENIFLQDPNAAVFGEFSSLSIGPGRTSLQDREAVVSAVMGLKARYVVIRPLFESDRLEELLSWFPSSSVIWLFRDSDAVVRSMIRKWDSRYFDISREVEQDGSGRWRLESLAQDINDQYHSLEDRYSAYWQARNSIVLDVGHEHLSKIRMLDYASFTSDPYTVLSHEIERYTGQPLNVASFFRYAVKKAQLSKSPLPIDPELKARIAGTYARMKQAER